MVIMKSSLKRVDRWSHLALGFHKSLRLALRVAEEIIRTIGVDLYATYR